MHAYVGAAKAAEKSGDAAKAKEYYGKVVAIAANADTTRTEVADARQTWAAEAREEEAERIVKTARPAQQCSPPCDSGRRGTARDHRLCRGDRRVGTYR